MVENDKNKSSGKDNIIAVCIIIIVILGYYVYTCKFTDKKESTEIDYKKISYFYRLNDIGKETKFLDQEKETKNNLKKYMETNYYKNHEEAIEFIKKQIIPFNKKINDELKLKPSPGETIINNMIENPEQCKVQ